MSSFYEVARMLNQMVPELTKGMTNGKRVFRNTKRLADGLADVQKRFKFFSDEISKAKAAQRKLEELNKEFKKVKETTQKVKDVTDKVLEKVPGGGTPQQRAASLGGKYLPTLVGLVAFGGVAALTKLSEQIQNVQEKFNDSIARDLSKALTSIQTNKSNIDKTNRKVKEFELSNQRTRDRTYALEKQIVPIRENANNALYEVREGRRILENQIEAARKLGNDALYEVRTGRETIDIKVSEARKLGNDALYETRQNRSLFDNLASQFNDLSSRVNQNLGNSINSTIATLKADIASAKAAAQKAENTNTLQDKLIDAAVEQTKALARALAAVPAAPDIVSLKNEVGAIKIDVSALRQSTQLQVEALSSQDTALAASIGNLAAKDKQLAAAIDSVDKRAVVPDLSPIQKALNDKFDAFVAQNNKDLNIRDLKTKDLTKSELSKEFDRRIADFERQSNLTSDQRFEEFQRQNRIDLGSKIDKLNATDTSLQADVSGLKTDLKKVGTDLSGLDTKIREREKVDIEANKKLDQMLPLIGSIPLLPGRVSDAIKPSIPTLPQINNEVGKAVCNSFNGGCGKSALDRQSADINNADKANNNDLLNKLNAGANAGQLAALDVINNKLGAQIPGGLSSKLVNGFKWLQLDRALNILTFAATVHNAAMLSNDIFQTLVGALTNVLTLILPKDDAGNAFNIGEAIGNTVENVVKGIVGEENYTNLAAGWAKANRIYQATTNVLNSFMSLTQVVLQASEMIAAYTGKIGNALKKGGVVLENAYGWMNPQPKFNRVLQTLENFQQAASTIQMVTQIPLDFVNATTELTTSATGFVTAIKEDDKPQNKAVPIPEPDELKAKEVQAKVDSQPNPFDFSDLFDGED
ncbi:hypothetical protein ACSQ6I_03790 [Anabaena sp. WFMT]|uniref:hypothetical protein n=1 Tax=Anabaena sp. WFMT TaxID=3449730 RepID=UPI003F237454